MHITEHASPCRISIHALLAESDTTRHISPLTQSHFYPRSPCGERPILGNPCAGCPAISIHALLAESDLAAMMPANRLAIISIHALLAESDPLKLAQTSLTEYISIHALLAESDVFTMIITTCIALFLSTLSLRRATTIPRGGHINKANFYPRSPCGERQSASYSAYLEEGISIHALLAESDPIKQEITVLTIAFLSTLSLRRATWPGLLARPFFIISIHALLAESDAETAKTSIGDIQFLSTLSLRRATKADSVSKWTAT